MLYFFHKALVGGVSIAEEKIKQILVLQTISNLGISKGGKIMRYVLQIKKTNVRGPIVVYISSLSSYLIDFTQVHFL